MLMKDLTKVYISEYTIINDHGEKSKQWKYKGIAYLNMQQNLNQLDTNNAGVVDYSIYNGYTNIDYDIKNGNGISLEDISLSTNIVPEFIVNASPKIGQTTTYKLEKNYD